MFSKSTFFKISLFLTFTFLLSACTKEPQAEFVKNVVITQARQGEIQTDFHLTGKVEASSSAYVSAKNPGRITQLFKEVGDTVVENELIGKLGGEESLVGYSSTATAVENLTQNLENVSELTQKQIEHAQQEKLNAIQNLELIRITEKNFLVTSLANLKSAELGVEQSKLNQENAEKMLNDTKAQIAQNSLNLNDNAKSSITQALILSNLTESTLDNLLGVTTINEHNNDTFEKNLGVLNQTTLTEAKKSLRLSLDLNNQLQKIYDSKINIKNPNTEDLKNALELAEKTLTQNKNALEDGYQVLEASTTGNQFSLDNLNSYKQQIITLGSQIENMLLSVSGVFVTGVKGVLQSGDNLKIQTSTLLNQAESNLIQAQKIYEIKKQELVKLKADLEMQKEDLSIKKIMAETQLNQTQLGIETAKSNQKTQTQLLQTQLDQAKGEQNLASVSIANTEIRAPFSGVITAKLIEIGTVVGAGTPIFKIETPSTLKIKTEIPEKDISYVSLGQPVLLFPPHNPEQQSNGIISKIEPTANPYSHKTGLEIEFDNPDKTIKIGSLFNLTLRKEHKTDALILPLSAVLNLYGETFVFKVNTDQTVQKVLVQTGILAKQNLEILSGISPTDQVVIKGNNHLRNGDKVKIISTSASGTSPF